jgi:hypothetical protein
VLGSINPALHMGGLGGKKGIKGGKRAWKVGLRTDNTYLGLSYSEERVTARTHPMGCVGKFDPIVGKSRESEIPTRKKNGFDYF